MPADADDVDAIRMAESADDFSQMISGPVPVRAANRPTYLLALRDDRPGDEDDPVALRLRLALKSLLRRFGLRCVRAEQHERAPAGSLADAIGTGKTFET